MQDFKMLQKLDGWVAGGYTPVPTKQTISTTYKKFLHEVTCHDAMVSDELGNAFVLDVTNKS
jgi:hypothetical protein